MNTLRINLLQLDLVWENPEANKKQIQDLLSELSPGSNDLFILPEMFTTGFSMESSRLAENMDGSSLRWLHQLADEHQAAFCGSLIIEEDGRFFNRLVWVEPGTGAVKTYDKKHLFSLAGEHKHYTAGNQHLILEYRQWKISFFICYDLRFPVWSRNTQGADLMIYVANWPTKRAGAWNRLLPARAIENQCFVAGINRVGTDGIGIDYPGDSAVYNFEGERILHLGASQCYASVILEKGGLEIYRRAYPFLNDRDHFQL